MSYAPPLVMSSSISAKLVHHMLGELRALGVLASPLAKPDVQSALLDGKPLPIDHLAHIFNTTTNAVAAQLAREHGWLPFSQSDTELLCRCALTARNLAEAIRCIADFCTAIRPRAGELALEQHGSLASFHMDSLRERSDPSDGLIEVVHLLSYQQFFSWLIAEPLRLKTVRLSTYGPSTPMDPFIALFSAEITVGAPRAGFEFDNGQLARPVVRRPAELDALLASSPFNLVSGTANTLSVAQKVRALINAELAQNVAPPSFSEIADTLGLSLATLRRRLREENIGYQALREQCLLDAAENHLRSGNRDIEHIAEALGFSDSNAFRRAFRRWTGHSPTATRNASHP